RFHWIVLISWQCMNFFGASNLFSIFSNFVPEWRCGDGPLGQNCTLYHNCNETITFSHVTFHSAAYE
ncbi:hypothetical protein PFISCL1PPCAC_28404, partial [Pristionchus fissidentatus]